GGPGGGTPGGSGSRSGSGGGRGSGSTPLPVPSVSASLDRQTVSTELFTSEMLTVTYTSEMGFTGDVTVNPTVVDAQNNPITGWTLTATPPSVTLTDGGT